MPLFKKGGIDSRVAMNKLNVTILYPSTPRNNEN